MDNIVCGEHAIMSVGNKQQKEFCAIKHWIEANDPGLYAAVVRVCMEFSLSSGRRNNPVTFIFPGEKVREQIKAASNDDHEKAIALLSAHILPLGLTKGNDFAVNKAELGSKNGNKLQLVSATDVEVVLGATGKGKGQATLTPVSIKSTRPIAIWKVTKGEMPLEGDQYNWMNAKQKKVRGGGERYGGRPLSKRAAIAQQLENQLAHLLSTDGYKKQHPYAAAMVGLILHLREKFPDELKKIALLMDYDPVASFYVVVQPYKTKGEHLLTDNAIETWNGSHGFGKVGKSYADLVEEATQEVLSDPSMVPSGEYYAYIDKLRSVVPTNLRAAGTVEGAFDVLSSKFGGRKLFPTEISGAQMRWNDELRYLVGSLILQCDRLSPDERVSRWNRMKLMLATMRPGNDFAGETTLTNPAHFRNNVNPALSHQNTMSLTHSTDFGHRGVSDLPNGGGVVATTPADFDYTVGGMGSFSTSKKKMVLQFLHSDIGQAVLQEYLKNVDGAAKEEIKKIFC